MRIVKDYSESDIIDTVEIINAKYINENLIEIHFSDGSIRSVDFEPFLSKTLHPSIKKYLDVDLFRQFKIKNGNLNWNDYELIFPIHDLYKGEL